MPLALEITLILVLIALAVGLVPLLHQLRRTAQSLDLFLLSTRKDLTQIAEDVHASRLRMDHLVGLPRRVPGRAVGLRQVGRGGGHHRVGVAHPLSKHH
ncbi:MAG: hypothetical protein IPI84_06600 [Holophagaceae bacterium]|nr:hypothetical protein [Holophagaceae bacterium]